MLALLLSLLAFAAPLQHPASTELSGNVRIVHEAAETPLEGWFDIWVNYAYGWSSTRVSVHDGSWTVRLRADVSRVAIGRMEFGGRAARSDFEAGKPFTAAPLSVDAHWTRENRIRIRAEDGSELASPLYAFRSDGVFGPSRFDRDRVSSAAPPLLLPEWLVDDLSKTERWAGSVRWWVSAHGYGWTPIEIDHSRGGDWWVELRRAGDLELRMRPKGRIDHARVYLEQAGESQWLGWWPDEELDAGPADFDAYFGELERRPLEVRVERIHVGDYDIVVTREFDCRTSELARVPVRVERDSVTRVELSLDAAELSDAAPCRGILRVPRAWGTVAPTVLVDVWCGGHWRYVETASCSPAESVIGTDLAWEWSAGTRATGTLRLRVEPLQALFEREFDAHAPRELELVVPPPTRCEVRVVDDVSGAALAPSELEWWGGDEHATAGLTVSCSPDRTFRFLAPRGRIVVGARIPGESFGRAPFDLSDGENVLELRLRRAHALRVSVSRDGKPGDVPAAWSIVAKPISGHGRVIEASRSDGEILLRFDEQGEYELTWPAADGWVGAAPVRAVVGGVEATRVAIALVPIAR
ncbi:MAG: hypothetical protein IT453_11285 [Planctomycetes bacterium]|nr:hypothetical protein [Planctomycetota bacterium]